MVQVMAPLPWPKPKAPRLQQGNRNRWVHLAVLHGLGMHNEASQFIARVRDRASDIDQSYQNHFWYMSNWGYDPSFGDF